MTVPARNNVQIAQARTIKILSLMWYLPLNVGKPATNRKSDNRIPSNIMRVIIIVAKKQKTWKKKRG